MHDSIRREAGHSDPVRAFVELHNRRFGRPSPGQEWVRVRPASEDEVTDMSRDPRCVKFLRVGSSVSVGDVDSAGFERFMVSVWCAGDCIVWNMGDFLGTFVKVVSQQAWRKSDSVRMHLRAS